MKALRLLPRSIESALRASALGLVIVAALVPIINAFDGPHGALAKSIPLLFLVPVVLSSTLGGRLTGIVVGLAATLAWDWFFVPPYYQITVASPTYFIGLLVFFLVAVITGQLATSVRNAALGASQRARSAEALYGLSVGLISRRDVMTTLPPLAEGIQETFDLEACAVLLPDPKGWTTVTHAGKLGDRFRVERSRDVAACATWVAQHGSATAFEASTANAAFVPSPALSHSRVRFLPLQVGTRSAGVLELVQRVGMTLDGEQERLLSTLTNGVALALEHDRLADEEQQALLAKESDRLKSVLLSSVSHDLRTPLAGIKASVSSLLQRDVRWSEADRDGFLEDIDSEVDRLTRLVANLLDLSRIDAGALHPQRDWEDLGEVVSRTAERLQPHIEDHELIVRVPPEPARAEVDAVHIEEVLSNLIDNAAKYGPADTPIEVVTELVVGPPVTIRLTVSDRGEAIPLAQRGTIFDKFYRLANSDVKSKGTGLGLAIVKGLVEANGGAVTIEDARPGNRFVVTFPGRDQQEPSLSDNALLITTES